MNSLARTRIAIAALGIVFVAGANVALAKENAAQKRATISHECFTEDGYGRKRSCAQGYRARRAEQTREDCFTDDSYGRRRPCAANFR